MKPAPASPYLAGLLDPLFCSAGNCIDLSFSRMSDVVIVHAGEAGMDAHFREALSAALEDLLRHRRECPKCSQFFQPRT